jgi:hypothetical protein
MGTFHQNKHEFHGITVVVDTEGPKVFVGRCDDMDDQTIILVGVDEHEEGDGKVSKSEFIAKAVKFGAWPRQAHLVLPLQGVTSVRPLHEYAG